MATANKERKKATETYRRAARSLVVPLHDLNRTDHESATAIYRYFSLGWSADLAGELARLNIHHLAELARRLDEATGGEAVRTAFHRAIYGEVWDGTFLV